MITFWVLMIAAIFWLIGALAFGYHAVSFRYPRDIIPSMVVVFILIIFPIVILLIGYLSDIYGGAF
jgi:small-conductance mechanosensitive channel